MSNMDSIMAVTAESSLARIPLAFMCCFSPDSLLQPGLSAHIRAETVPLLLPLQLLLGPPPLLHWLLPCCWLPSLLPSLLPLPWSSAVPGSAAGSDIHLSCMLG
jgi:hypothetical protein